MTDQEIGEVLKFPQIGKSIYSLIHQYPRFELQAFIVPITSTYLKIELEVKQVFTWDQKVHGRQELFHIIVEDVDEELILHHEILTLSQSQLDDIFPVSFYVSLYTPMPPHYFVKLISDKWVRSETQLPISFRHLILPDKFPSPTPLEDSMDIDL